MSFDFDSKLYADDKTLVVDGFIRENQDTLPQYLPPFINDFILVFIIGFEWESLEKGWYIDTFKDNNEIKQHKCNDGVYGNLFTKSLMHRNIHHWLLRVDKINEASDTILGIIEEGEQLSWMGNSIWQKQKAFGFVMTKGKLTTSLDSLNVYNEYGVAMKQHDFIKMIVDMRNYELRYCINEKKYGVAFELKRGMKYRFAMSIGGKATFRLLSYHVTL